MQQYKHMVQRHLEKRASLDLLVHCTDVCSGQGRAMPVLQIVAQHCHFLVTCTCFLPKDCIVDHYISPPR